MTAAEEVVNLGLKDLGYVYINSKCCEFATVEIIQARLLEFCDTKVFSS